MKIKRELPQFIGERALFIVAGEYAVRYWLATEGEMTESGEFSVHQADYPDRQGYSEVRGHGQTFTYEALDIGKDNWRQKEFLEELKKAIPEKIETTEASSVYLFAEKEAMGIIKRNIPARYKKLIRGTYPKNLVKSHPFRLLEEIG